jgi:ferredoxin, 2Fe-2S
MYSLEPDEPRKADAPPAGPWAHPLEPDEPNDTDPPPTGPWAHPLEPDEPNDTDPPPTGPWAHPLEPDEPNDTDPPSAGSLVRVEPSGHEILVGSGESLLAAAIRQGYRWPTLCNGVGECTICFVKMLVGTANVAPAQHAERERLDECGRYDPDIRLACQLEVRGPITVLKRGLRKRE